MNKKEARELLDKYLNGTATPEERMLFEQLSNQVTRKRLATIETENMGDIKSQIYRKLPQAPNRSFIQKYRFITAAASIAAIVSIVTLFYQQGKVNQQNAEVVPGGNRAILTLANGKKIELTSVGDGELAKQTGISIKKTHNGELVYTMSAQGNNVPVEYNTTETPRGGQYQLELADGTKVWLNASSSLRYPTRFAGKERRVELTGEAYFEVTHNASMPFKVKTDKEVVTVLGTHFNVNAYHDEPFVKTTLLEGKVRINALKSHTSGILKPGEQAILTDGQIKIAVGDTEAATAWKNGYFRFRGENITSIMRKLSRWYNIDVQYATTISDEGYYGTISRFKNIKQVLAVLSETGSVHFKVDGRRVTVME